ncbi:hypothetical protein DFS34DRAFT_56636 [Phlyctochytrium arcticum]|nr:hypothetical protein DFS34DRAFT_56636 [Phlyctochytrium arcticum]
MDIQTIADISFGLEAVPVGAQWENGESNGVEFPTFKYIATNHVPERARGIKVYGGCACLNSELCGLPRGENSVDTTGCTCHPCPYDSLTKLLLPSPPSILYECTSLCSCPSSCPTRLVQHGLRVRMTVIRPEHISGVSKGWGLRVDQDLQEGQFVVEYVGEVVGTAEAQWRWKDRQSKGIIGNYILCLREHGRDGTILRTNIDPTDRGNAARFISVIFIGLH